MTLIFGGYPIDNGGGGGSTAITWKYPEMAMYLVDKDKFDAIIWKAGSEIENYIAFADSILVGINECELIYPVTFMEDLQTVGQADIDLNKNNQRIATMTLSAVQQTVTFSSLAGELSNKNIQCVILGQQPDGETNRGAGIDVRGSRFAEATLTIYMRDYMNVGGEG